MEENTALPLAGENLVGTSLPQEVKTGEAPPPAEPKVDPAKTEANPQKWRLKVNREELEVEHDKVIEYAQKGMDYDRIHTELLEKRKALEELQNHPGVKFVENASKKTKIPPSELVAKWEAEELRRQDAAKAAETKKPIEVIQALREKDEAKQEADVIKAELEKKKQKEVADKQFAEEMREFIRNHPDVKELPEEVTKDVENGIPIAKAYSTYELKVKVKELEDKLKTQEANASNAEASTGALGSAETGVPFEITEEAIAKMTPDELKKNHAKVWAFLTGAKK